MIHHPLINIKKVLVANRGEIAVRCIEACKELGVKSVAIFTNADSASLHVSLADEAVLLSGSDGTAYTDGDAILEICKRRDVDAVIPGYGFLSENAEFASKVTATGLIFVGPSVDSINAMGLKHEAREIAQAANVPIIPGSPLLTSCADAIVSATNVGFPVMLKATGGGGGMGLQTCDNEEDVEKAFSLVESRAATLFKNSGVFLEKYYPRSRHIEVQVVGNGEVVVSFGERECSLQRRHQKVVEECPSPFVERNPDLRERLLSSAIRYASKLKYKSVGTVEFLVDDETADFFFLEMNTRLQVEHGITELCYGVDLVHLMLRQADHEKAGEPGIPSDQLKGMGRDRHSGAAIEARIYAEAPLRDFAPSPGLLQNVQWPYGDGIRVDTWVKSGQRIFPYYDPLVAKVMVHSRDGRASAQQKLLGALATTVIQGAPTNLKYVTRVLESSEFTRGNTLTNFLSHFQFRSCVVQVIEAGFLTTVQDYPGRPAVAHGVPKGGPMDDVSSRVANILVGNDAAMELLEVTLTGPELFFHVSAVVSVCGAEVPVSVDGETQPMWSRLAVKQGQKLKIGKVKGKGFRSYVAIKGGFPQIPEFLGSKSTAPELGFGGIQGRKLVMHDLLDLSPKSKEWAASMEPFSLSAGSIPDLDIKHIYCMEGPYGSDEMITPEDRESIYASSWTVSHNSSRSGVRLVGPKLKWARTSGGGGGSHPSNVVDYGCPDGGLNWTGDDAIIFTNDSPDLSGFACSTTICSAELWKVGQLRPGDQLRFVPTTFGNALKISHVKEAYIRAVVDAVNGKDISVPSVQAVLGSEHTPSILQARERRGHQPKVTYRQGGDRSIIVEYGNQVPGLENATRVRLLHEQLLARGLKGVVLLQNIGTLTVKYDPFLISQAELLKLLAEVEDAIGDATNARIPVREVRLPACVDHPAIQQATQRYMDTIRPSAVYLPDNVEYLRKNNALSSRRAVFDALFQTPWLAIAVGFYVGTPILFPLDPRYSYVGQKYNPSRVYTPGGSIGLGGSLLGLYTTTSPGGYQFMGRTLESWDPSGTRPGFRPDRPWLFNHFDIVRFFEVNLEEYNQMERDHAAGRYVFDVRDTILDVGTYSDRFEAARRDPVHQEWKRRQLAAAKELGELELELAYDWKDSRAASNFHSLAQNAAFLESDKAVNFVSTIHASVWKILVKVGDVLKKGQTIAVLEAMKMEIEISCSDDQAGTIVKAVRSPPGTIVSPGTTIVVGLAGSHSGSSQ